MFVAQVRAKNSIHPGASFLYAYIEGKPALMKYFTTVYLILRVGSVQAGVGSVSRTTISLAHISLRVLLATKRNVHWVTEINYFPHPAFNQVLGTIS